MGTCTSLPKAMRGKVGGGAPPPEPPKEEPNNTITEVTEVQAAEKEATVEGGEKKTDGGNDIVKQEDEKNKDGESRSLGSLLESEEVKETSPKTVKISSEAKIAAEEEKLEALLVSDKASEEQDEPTENVVAPYIAQVARATEEEKET